MGEGSSGAGRINPNALDKQWCVFPLAAVSLAVDNLTKEWANEEYEFGPARGLFVGSICVV